jgi:maltose O-acetyltransferase
VAGPLRVCGPRGITLGEHVFFLDGPISTELVCAEGGELFIDRGTGLNYGGSIQATRSVRIGADCLFGAMVRIRDDDGLRCAPVVIGARVWVAHGAIIEPGVTIGDGAVISAGAVVTGPVPPDTMAMGNPARCVPLGLSARRGPMSPAA